MTRKEANIKARQMAKNAVKQYFLIEGVENFNMNISLLKMELSRYFKMYWSHWCSERKTFVVISLSGKIYE